MDEVTEEIFRVLMQRPTSASEFVAATLLARLSPVQAVVEVQHIHPSYGSHQMMLSLSDRLRDRANRRYPNRADRIDRTLKDLGWE